MIILGRKIRSHVIMVIWEKRSIYYVDGTSEKIFLEKKMSFLEINEYIWWTRVFFSWKTWKTLTHMHTLRFVTIFRCYHNLAETISYLKERKAFGQPLINNQYIHFRLAELHTEVEMFRAMVYAGKLAFGGAPTRKWQSFEEIVNSFIWKAIICSGLLKQRMTHFCALVEISFLLEKLD